MVDQILAPLQNPFPIHHLLLVSVFSSIINHANGISNPTLPHLSSSDRETYSKCDIDSHCYTIENPHDPEYGAWGIQGLPRPLDSLLARVPQGDRALTGPKHRARWRHSCKLLQASNSVSSKVRQLNFAGSDAATTNSAMTSLPFASLSCTRHLPGCTAGRPSVAHSAVTSRRQLDSDHAASHPSSWPLAARLPLRLRRASARSQAQLGLASS